MSEGNDLKSTTEIKASVKDYFERDCPRNAGVLTAQYTFNVNIKSERTGREWDIPIERHLSFDYNALSIYSQLYIAEPDSLVDIPKLCQGLIDLFITDPLHNSPPALRSNITLRKNELDRSRSSHSMIDSRKMVFYIDREISDFDKQSVYQYGDSKGMYAQIRDRRYADMQSSPELPLAFISHDSRDKDSIAWPLAKELMKVIGRVWFDEYSLKVGDSLREKIETGLKQCKRCILILTTNFLCNTGWTKTEFNSVFTRELIERTNVIIPVWSDVTQQQVYNYSPSLVNKFAAKWNDGCVTVAQKIKAAILDSE
jgi:hypothetical protein